MLKTRYLRLLALVVLLAGATTSCRRSSDQVWEDTKTGGRYMGNGVKSIAGKHSRSQQYSSPEEFAGPAQDAYIPMEGFEKDHALASNDFAVPQARTSPGDPGSGLPGIEGFIDPSGELSRVFKKIYFNTDSAVIGGMANQERVQQIVTYLKKHPNVYVFIEGHCDERGPAAYNLALGTRRSNSIRNLLVQQGISPERLFTVSYGKEKPEMLGSNPESWQANRRGQFKVYEKG